jgi:hypothetical protein
MLQTFEAKLTGNQLEWIDEIPELIDKTYQPISVYVTFREAKPIEESDALRKKQRIAEALEKLAAMDAVADITDPVAWQREVRQDRPLPFRE